MKEKVLCQICNACFVEGEEAVAKSDVDFSKFTSLVHKTCLYSCLGDQYYDIEEKKEFDLVKNVREIYTPDNDI